MTELNGEFRHLEFMKRRGRRAPSECGEAIPKALSPPPYDIINGEVVQRQYKDQFQGFEPNRPLNLFEKSSKDDADGSFRHVRKSVSEPKIGSKSGRPRVPDILSKPRVPDELLHTRTYDNDFWSTASSIAGETGSVYSVGSLEDDFDERFHLRQNHEPTRPSMPKWYQNAFGNDEYGLGEQRRFESPKASPPRSEPAKYYQARNEPDQLTNTKHTRQSPVKYEIPFHDNRKYNRQTSDPARHIDQIYDTRRNDDQRTFIIKNEKPRYTEPKYEKASSSVSQAAVYKRVRVSGVIDCWGYGCG